MRRLVAMGAALALGAGLLTALEVMNPTTAQAVTYLNGWDGQFATNQLWLLGADQAGDWQTSRPRLVTNPQNLGAEQFSAAIREGYDRSANANGNPCTDNWDVMTMGTVRRAAGPPALVQIGWDTQTGQSTAVMSGSGHCFSVGDLTDPDIESGYEDAAPGGGMRPDGDMYLTRGEEPLAGNATINSQYLRVVRVSEHGATARPAFGAEFRSVSSPAGRWNGTNLGQYMYAQGKPATVANWTLQAAVAFDGNSIPYRMVRSEQPSGPDYWALLATDGAWAISVVKAFQDVDAAPVVSMAFHGGSLYTVHSDGSLRRWNTTTGASEELMPPGSPLKAVASAQTANVVQGNLGGVNVEAQRQNAYVEVWGEQFGTRHKLGTLYVNPGNGQFWTTLETSSEPYYLRLRPHRITSARPLTILSQVSTTVTGDSDTQAIPLCTTAQGDYQEMLESTSYTPCYGARADGVDPVEVTDPLAAEGGANSVIKVLYTSPAVVTTYFGVTSNYSWGDAPDGYKTYNSSGGPNARPELLRMGGYYITSTDGRPSSEADTNRDDGMQIAAARPDGIYTEADFQGLQGFMMRPGSTYRLRAHVAGELAARAVVKAWLTPLVSGRTDPTNMSTELVFSQADAAGFVYANYTVPATPPEGHIQTAFLRARVSTDPGVTATSRVPAGVQADGVGAGEVEDYAFGITDSLITVRTHNEALMSQNNYGGSHTLRFGVTNTISRFPSNAQPQTPLVEGGQFQVAPEIPAQPVTITMTAAGPTNSSDRGPWWIQPEKTVCVDEATGQAATVILGDNSWTVDPPSGGSLGHVVCDVFIQVDPGSPTRVGIQPHGQTVPVGGFYKFMVGAVAAGTAYNVAEGVGTRARLTIEPADSSSPEGGAFFAANHETSITCVTGPNARCEPILVTANQVGNYTLRLFAADTGTLISSDGLMFADFEVAGGELTIRNTADKQADYGLEEGVIGYQPPADFYTADIRLWDPEGRPLAGHAADIQLRDEWDYHQHCPANNGLRFSPVEEVTGQSGQYRARIYSNCADTYMIVATLAESEVRLMTNPDIPPEELYWDDYPTVTFLPLGVMDPSK
ncbi:MAG: hypothetical protein LBH68_07345, partial [Bifidobacteriaceae bacterium]|nr:hypothetical protein [Bifidobacteriaceae bacterium]